VVAVFFYNADPFGEGMRNPGSPNSGRDQAASDPKYRNGLGENAGRLD